MHNLFWSFAVGFMKKKLRKLNDTPHFGMCPRKQEVDDIVIFFQDINKKLSYKYNFNLPHPTVSYPKKMLAITACHHA